MGEIGCVCMELAPAEFLWNRNGQQCRIFCNVFVNGCRPNRHAPVAANPTFVTTKSYHSFRLTWLLDGENKAEQIEGEN